MTRCYEHKFRSDQLRAVCKSWESVDNEVVVEIHPRPVSIESTVDSEKIICECDRMLKKKVNAHPVTEHLQENVCAD